MIIKESGELNRIHTLTTMLFEIKETDGNFKVNWRKEVLELIKQPRYIGWFSGIDLARTNFETTLNALCNTHTHAAEIVKIQQNSIYTDANFNQIIFQCFRELGIL